MMTFLLLFYEAVYTFIPSFWITFFIILWEGLLGGGTYVNGFYQLSSSVSGIQCVCVSYSMVVLYIMDHEEVAIMSP